LNIESVISQVKVPKARPARPGATEAGECHAEKNPVWAKEAGECHGEKNPVWARVLWRSSGGLRHGLAVVNFLYREPIKFPYFPL
jgi:hypothetical protein